MKAPGAPPLAVTAPGWSHGAVDLPITPALREELARLRLAFCCEECLHFCEAREACDLLYPPGPHRRGAFEAPTPGQRLVFCKMFEAR